MLVCRDATRAMLVSLPLLLRIELVPRSVPNMLDSERLKRRPHARGPPASRTSAFHITCYPCHIVMYRIRTALKLLMF